MKCHYCGESVPSGEYIVCGIDLRTSPPPNLYAHRSCHRRGLYYTLGKPTPVDDPTAERSARFAVTL